MVCGSEWPFYSWIVILDCWDRLYTGYVLRVELPVQRRLCPIFVKDVGSPGIHEPFRGLTGSQRTLGIWGVTAWYQSLGIRIPRELGFGYPSPLGWFDVSLGMRLTRKARNKTRTLYVCFVCDLMNCCVKNMHNINYV